LKKNRLILGLLLVLTIVVIAYIIWPIDLPWSGMATPTATSASGDPAVQTPTPETTLAPTPTPAPVTRLTLWVPPEMDPEGETESGRLLANRLQLFSELHDGLEITVRVKAASGSGGLLDALTSTSAVAPDALPDLIALERPDLETAALKGLIFSLDGLTSINDDPDWYGFTREMSLLQGSTFGLPFAVDALSLVYRPVSFPEPPGSWNEIMGGNIKLAFPADNNQALFTLALYQAEGGNLQDNQRRPLLELAPLTSVFQRLKTGVDSGVLPSWLGQFQTFSQVWSGYREGESNLAVIWLSDYLREIPADSTIAPLPPMASGPFSLGTGLSWAVATPDETRRNLAVDLAEFLVDPIFLSEWTTAAGYIPSRPSSLEGWSDSDLQKTVNQIAENTHLLPSNDLISSLAPILRENTLQILQGIVEPGPAAQAAVDSLEE
jgi:ABC-type glycerol-3-phosphate transport system substrate-binding protein